MERELSRITPRFLTESDVGMREERMNANTEFQQQKSVSTATVNSPEVVISDRQEGQEGLSCKDSE